jgi:hypothetical protein
MSASEVLHKNGRPLGCEEDDTCVYTKTCGLGWRFTICHDSGEEPEIDIFFDAHVASIELGPLTAAVVWEPDDASFTTINIGETRLVRLGSWYQDQIDAQPHFSFNVSFTATGLDLP